MLEGFINVTPILSVGVYALLRNGAVVYVGQSRKMLSRVYAHRANLGRKSMPSWMPATMRGIVFDELFVLPCRIEDLDRIEREMIDFYKPRYNVKLKAPTPVAVALQLTTTAGGLAHINHRPPLQFERRL